jgi:16S rRNA (cytosine967-C5)-methyltransferase
LRQDLTRTPPYREGLVQIQDEASQWVGHVVSPEPGERILDLCAGFGGKSTHLGALMENRGEIVSVDEAAWKIEELRGNALRQSITIIGGRAAGALELSPGELGDFDRVLLDAPCSGFGSIRRNPDIKWRRGPKDPYRFSRIQNALLQQASRFVRKGGVLVYATCTVFGEENERVAERFEAENPHWRGEPAADFLPEASRSMAEGPFFRSWPHRHGVDGFFIARWRRTE